MITWLNKQLNDKPGFSGSLLPPPPISKYSASTLSKPPTAAIGSTSFKPSFASIEQLNGGYVPGNRGTSFERSPSYRAPNIPSPASSVIGMNTPTSSMSSSITASLAQSSTLNVKTHPNNAEAPKAFTYTVPNQTNNSANKENTNTLNNLPQPQFVSKYAQQLYL